MYKIPQMAPAPNFFNLVHIIIPDIRKTWGEMLFSCFPNFFAYIFLKLLHHPTLIFPYFVILTTSCLVLRIGCNCDSFPWKWKDAYAAFYLPYLLLFFKCYLFKETVSFSNYSISPSLCHIFSFSDYFCTFLIKGNKQISIVAHQVKGCSPPYRLVK